MASQDLRLHVFAGSKDAEAFAPGKRAVLPDLDANIQKDHGPVVKATYTRPLERFRLLEGTPFSKLLPEELVSNWIAGIVRENGTEPFRIYTLRYDKDSGQIDRDADGNPVLAERYGITKGERFCDLCTLIHSRITGKKEKQPDYLDPCARCNAELGEQVVQFVERCKRDACLLMSNLKMPISQEQAVGFSKPCWAGLVSSALPLLVYDVIVGFAMMGQKRVASLEQTTDEEQQRNHILAELGISQEEYHKRLPEHVHDDLSQICDGYLVPLRATVQPLQNLAASQYGRYSHAKAQLLTSTIRTIVHERFADSPSSQQTIWSKLGAKALKQIADFFSFWQAYLFTGNSRDGVRLLASYWRDPHDRPQAGASPFGPNKPSNDEEIENRLATFPDPLSDEAKKTAVLLSPEKDYWYLFTDRKHSNRVSRASFNDVCKYLLNTAVRSFHSDMRQSLIVSENQDNLLAMAHNMKRPSAQLANALVRFNTMVYGRHFTEATSVFAQYTFLREAVDILYNAAVSANKKVDFEVEKVTFGQDIEKILKRRKTVPILGDDVGLMGDPLSLWGKAEDSIATFAGVAELASLHVDAKVVSPFHPEEYVYIHPKELQVALDNLSDNAVKYSFEGKTITIRLSRESGESGNQEYAVYRISNYGNGIDPEERGQIGEKFYRGKYSSTKNTEVEGTGLGVYTVRRIMEHIRGRLDWTSSHGGECNYVPGEGWMTVFCLYFPIHKGNKARKK